MRPSRSGSSGETGWSGRKGWTSISPVAPFPPLLPLFDIILPADGRIRAVRADALFVRLGRKFAVLYGGHHRQQARPRIGKHRCLVVFAVLPVDHGDERLLAGEGDVGRFIDLPRAAAVAGEPLLRTQRVDG